MSEEKELREIVETNFRLGILYTQQVGSRLDRRMDGLGSRMDGLGSRMDGLAATMSLLASEMKGLGTDIRSLGNEISADFNGLAAHQSQTLEVLRKWGDSSVDIRKDIDDLKRRVSELEDRDKAS